MVVKVKYKMLTSKEGKTYRYIGVKGVIQMGDKFALRCIEGSGEDEYGYTMVIDPKECESIQIEEDIEE